MNGLSMVVDVGVRFWNVILGERDRHGPRMRMVVSKIRIDPQIGEDKAVDYTFGPVYRGSVDGPRLKRQMEIIRDFMLKSDRRTLREIADATGFPEASVSAQLRHLRKARFGGYTVEKQRRDGVNGTAGTWIYRVRAPQYSEPDATGYSDAQRVIETRL